MNTVTLDEDDRYIFGLGFEIAWPFSVDATDALRNYLIHGLTPGGFLCAMIAYDYERALYNADVLHRQKFWLIAMHIRNNMPSGSVGSYDNMRHWLDNKDDMRTMFIQEVEKRKVWDKLQQTH